MRLLFFLLLNFGALALGSFLMGEGPTGIWYSNLNKAPGLHRAGYLEHHGHYYAMLEFLHV